MISLRASAWEMDDSWDMRSFEFLFTFRHTSFRRVFAVSVLGDDKEFPCWRHILEEESVHQKAMSIKPIKESVSILRSDMTKCSLPSP